MPAVGPGVIEIRVHSDREYRIFCVAKFPESENLRIRSDLMIRLSEIIERRGLTQARATSLLGVTQPRISDLMRGKIQLFSVDSLIEMLGRAGAKVSVRVKNRRRAA